MRLSLLFISFVTFVAGAFSGVDPAVLQAGEKATAVDVARIRHELGLDRPWPVRYVEYVNNAAHGDFGNSYTGTKEPVKNHHRAMPADYGRGRAFGPVFLPALWG